MNRLYQTILRNILIAALTLFYAEAQDIPASLADTSWHLKSFQSMDDAVGTITPDDPSRYTMTLKHNGTVSMRLNCNHAGGIWSAAPSDDRTSGQFIFGPLAMTKMLCPPPSMDTKIAMDAQYIRSYLLKDGNLYLTLMADAGIYTWEPDNNTSNAKIYTSPENGGARYWKVIGSSKLALYESTSTSSAVIAHYMPDTILNNLGCQHIEEKEWCDVQELGGGLRGYVETALLKPLTDNNGSMITGANDSALRAGERKFDARGKLNCSIDKNPKTICEYGIAYDRGGDASMVITRPDGHTRAIFFQLGKPMGADTSQADGYPDFRVSKEKNIYIIDLGREYYEIPDTIIANP